MKIEYVAAVSQTRLHAVPDVYDGFPVPDALILDIATRHSSAARIAVAATLAFGPQISGRLELPQLITPELATAIEQFLAPTTVFISDLTMKPQPPPLGTSTFAMSGNATTPSPPRSAAAGTREIELGLAPMGDSFSPHLTMRRLSIPTNAGTIAASRPPAFEHLPFVAAAALLAEDYGVGTLRLPPGGYDGESVTALGALLQPAGLRLEGPDRAST